MIAHGDIDQLDLIGPLRLRRERKKAFFQFAALHVIVSFFFFWESICLYGIIPAKGDFVKKKHFQIIPGKRTV